MKIVKKISHSHTASAALKLGTNKSIVMPVVTRWSYLALTYGRIIEVFDEINRICDDQKWPKLLESDRNLMKAVLKLVEPFKEITVKLQASSSPTLSMIFPAISFLIQALEVIFKFYLSKLNFYFRI